MKRIISSMLFSLLITLPTTFAFAQTPENLGESLEKDLFQTVVNKDWNKLDATMSPAYQEVHENKIYDKQSGMKHIQSLQFSNYKFNDFHVTTNPKENILVVTYTLTYDETVGTQVKTGESTKNLSVWTKGDDGKWHWVAHSVLD